MKDTILVQFYAKPERKSMKCQDFSDLNLNDLGMAFKVNENFNNCSMTARYRNN